MSLFGSLTVGTSGLKVSQYGMNVVAHNLANVDTEGYVRQQTVLETATVQNIGGNSVSTFQVGLGVNPEAVRQVRDFFLDKAYRTEVGREAYYESQAAAVDEIEELFGEIQGVAFRDSLSDLWVSMQELSKEPDSRVTQATFIESGVSFLERANEIYNQLKTYQHDLNTKIKDQINRINEIGSGIKELNIKISRLEADGRENANDLRDERNNLLDELSGIVKTDYRELENGMVVVSVEDTQFVTEDNYFKMGSMTVAEYRAAHGINESLDEASDILIAVWPHMGDKDVYDFSQLPSSTANTDIGGLKGAIQARGDRIGKYTDIPVEPQMPKREDFATETEYTAAMAVYNKEKDNYALETNIYNYGNKDKHFEGTEASIIMRTQAQFDQLIHGIITMINDALCPNIELDANTSYTLADGSTLTLQKGTKILDPDAPIGLDKNSTVGTEFFSRKTVDRYQEYTLSDNSVLRVYNEEDPDDNYTLYTLGEVEVNLDLLSDKSRLPILSPNGTGDFDIKMVEGLIDKWQEPFATLSPNTLTRNDVMSYYTQFTGAIATKGDEYKTLADNQNAMVGSIQEKRIGVHGVSSDEELTYLIKFQHAYNASARYINVIDEMLEHVIERLG